MAGPFDFAPNPLGDYAVSQALGGMLIRGCRKSVIRRKKSYESFLLPYVLSWHCLEDRNVSNPHRGNQAD